MATLGLTRVDPYKNFAFVVELDGIDVAGFSKMGGHKQTTEVISYREGGDNSSPRKLTGQTTFDNITLERGTTANIGFYTWASLVFNPLADIIPENLVKHFLTVKLRDKTGKTVKEWQILNAWPTEFSAGDMDASASGVLVENLTIAHEGFILTKSV